MAGRRRMLLLGDARQVHLARWAEAFVARGWDVEAATLESPRAFPVRLHVLRAPGALPHALRYPLAVPALRVVAERYRPHLVSAHYATNYGVMAALLGRRPWVLSTWGSDILVDPRRTPMHRLRARAVVRAADHVTSDARVMTECLVAMGVPPGRISTFPFGVDTRRFRPASRPPADGPRVISVRKLEPLYDVATAIRALARVRRDLPGARLTVAGDGSRRADLEALARRLGVADAVDFVGDVDHARLADLLAAHHVYVSTARSDTTSVSLLEAMACGLFPVVTDIPANREWVDDDGGLRVPCSDAEAFARAIAAAWDDAPRREALRRRLPQRVRERADWDVVMRGVVDRFEALADRAAP